MILPHQREMMAVPAAWVVLADRKAMVSAALEVQTEKLTENGNSVGWTEMEGSVVPVTVPMRRTITFHVPIHQTGSQSLAHMRQSKIILMR